MPRRNEADTPLLLRAALRAYPPADRRGYGDELLEAAVELSAEGSEMREAAGLVWSFVTAHWDRITSEFPSSMHSRLLEGIRGITDRALATEVASFLDAHPLDHGGTVIRQHLERMWVTVALAERAPTELADALA